MCLICFINNGNEHERWLVNSKTTCNQVVDLRFILVQMYALINVCPWFTWPEPHWLLAWIATAHSHRRSAILSLTTCLQLQSISHCQDFGWPNLTAYINLCVTAWYLPLYSTLPSCQLCKYCHLQPLNRNATVDPQYLGYSGSKSSVITINAKSNQVWLWWFHI